MSLPFGSQRGVGTLAFLGVTSQEPVPMGGTVQVIFVPCSPLIIPLCAWEGPHVPSGPSLAMT